MPVRPENPAPFTFVVRIRHPDLVVDHDEQQAALCDLFRSLDAQADRRFALLIACNPGQALPALPGFARRVEADIPLDLSVRDAETLEERAIAVRHDKGLRLRHALDAVDRDAYVMCLDDDDLVSRRLVEFILAQDRKTGWVIDLGYVWTPGEDHVHRLDNFHRLCGTSLIVPARYFKHVRGGYGEDEALQELGSHKLIVDEAGALGHVFRPVPFRAAIYRRGHANATQVDVARIAASEEARRPPPPVAKRALDRLRKLRRQVFPEPRTLTSAPRIDIRAPVPLSDDLRAEFFGAPKPAPAPTETRQSA